MVEPTKSTMYLRGIREDVVREAKALAAREGVTLTAFVERAMQRESRSAQPAPQRLSEIAGEMDWYEENKPALLKQYEDHYLAIVGTEVADYDADLEALIRRVDERFGGRSIYLPLCRRETRQSESRRNESSTVDVRSPRIAR